MEKKKEELLAEAYSLLCFLYRADKKNWSDEDKIYRYDLWKGEALDFIEKYEDLFNDLK